MYYNNYTMIIVAVIEVVYYFTFKLYIIQTENQFETLVHCKINPVHRTFY